MESITLAPISKINGEVNMPGSKSLSNRALLLAAMAEGTTEITNLLDSDDVQRMLEAMSALGVSYELFDGGTRCVMQGLGRPLGNGETMELFLGNAGTAMRSLTGAMTLGKGEFTLTGIERMEERPIGDLVDALRAMDCDVTYLKNEGFPPLLIKANGLKGGKVKIDGTISSQFLTALLMSAPHAQNDMEIEIVGELVSKPYIDITTHIMAQFGVEVINNNYQSFVVKAGQTYKSPGKFMVEGDASSASYFLAAGAIKGGRIKVTGIGKKSIQGDVAFAKVLEDMGAKVEWFDEYLIVEGGDLVAIDQDMNHIPDAAMTIATTALFAKGTTAIRNIYNWRVKETDRLHAMATELRKVGATVVEGEDFIEVTPPAKIQHAEIETYDDHRIAMCFSLVALDPECGITILDPGCTAKTFPDFFDRLASVSES